jgi:hypothetical protein
MYKALMLGRLTASCGLSKVVEKNLLWKDFFCASAWIWSNETQLPDALATNCQINADK